MILRTHICQSRLNSPAGAPQHATNNQIQMQINIVSFFHCPRWAQAVFRSSLSTSTTFISVDRVGLSSHRSRWYTSRVRSQFYSHKQKQNRRTVWDARTRPARQFSAFGSTYRSLDPCRRPQNLSPDLSFGRQFESAPLSPARIPHLLLTASGRTLVEEAGLCRRRRGSDQSAAALMQPIKDEAASALSWSDGIRPKVTKRQDYKFNLTDLMVKYIEAS